MLGDYIVKNIQSMLRNWSANDVYHYTMNGEPVDGAAGTGVNILGPGSTIRNIATGSLFVNFGTKASPVWLACEGPHVGYTKKVSITSAQMKALRATPITVVPALGAGLVAVFDWGSLAQIIGSNVFTNTQNLGLKYKDGAGVQVCTNIAAAGFLDQNASIQTSIQPKADAQATKAACDNQPLVLHNIGGSEITGNAGNDNVIVAKVGISVFQPGW